MFNHLRTLLLNQSAAQAQPASFPGEELVPVGYRPVALPPTLAAVRRILFGSAPDRAYLNWRLRQYLGLLDATELRADGRRRDARVTYDAGFNDAGLRVTRAATPAGLTLLGDPVADDAAGRIRYLFRIVVSSPTVAVVTTPAPPDDVVVEYATAAGRGGPVVLSRSGVAAEFVTPAVGAAWDVTVLAAPAKPLPAVVRELEDYLGAGSKLFGTGTGRQFRSWQAVWQKRDEPAYKLCAVLLALGERTYRLTGSG